MKLINCDEHGDVEPHKLTDEDEIVYVVCPRCFASKVLSPRLEDYSDELV